MNLVGCDVLIVTAAGGEGEAVRAVSDGMVTPWRELPAPPSVPNLLWFAEFKGLNDRPLRVVLVRALRQGAEATVGIVQQLLPFLNPSCVAMSGVCAGVPGYTTIGDVVIADSLWRYDLGRRLIDPEMGDETFHHEVVTYQMPANWLQPAQQAERPDFAAWPDSEKFQDWRIHVGGIATGSSVVTDGSIWKRLEKVQRKTIGLEMEGSAMGFLGWSNTQAQGKSLPVIVVKGVMDHAGSGKNDDGRKFAARAAAEVLLSFLRKRLVCKSQGPADFLETKIVKPAWALGGPPNPSSVLIPSHRVVPYDHRVHPEVWHALEAWCQEPFPPPPVRLFTGAGGSGKTRLFIEWCERLRLQGWHAGFLKPLPSKEGQEKYDDDFDRLVNWLGSIFLVIDYAEGRNDAFRRIEAFAQRDPALGPWRIVLLAREEGEWFKTIKQLSSDQVRYWLEGVLPMRLQSKAITGALRTEMWGTAFRTFGALMSGNKTTPAVPVDLTDDRFGRTLFLHAAALSSLLGQEPRADNVLSSIIEHEEKCWINLRREAIVTAPEKRLSFIAEVSALVAAITLLGGVSSRDEAIKLGKCLSEAGSDDISIPIDLLLVLYPGEPWSPLALYASPLQPDLLGEELVRRVFKSKAIEIPHFMHQIFSRKNIDQQRVGYGLMVLGRIGEDGLSRDLVAPAMKAIVEEDLVGRAVLAVEVAKSLGERTATSPLGDVLAAELEKANPDNLFPALLEAIQGYPTLSLAKISKWSLLKRLSTDKLGDEEMTKLYSELCAVHVSLGEYAEGIKMATKAVETARTGKALETVSSNSLSNSLAVLAEAKVFVGQNEEALALSIESVEAARMAGEAALFDLVIALNAQGLVLSSLQRREEALQKIYEASVIVQERLLQKEDGINRVTVALIFNNLCKMFIDVGKPREGTVALEKARERFEVFALDRPDAYMPLLALIKTNLGVALPSLGRKEEGLQQARESANIYRKLDQARPGAFAHDFVRALKNLAEIALNMREWAEAMRIAEEAVSILSEKQVGTNSFHRSSIAGSLALLSFCLSHMGQHQEAIARSQEAYAIAIELRSEDNAKSNILPTCLQAALHAFKNAKIYDKALEMAALLISACQSGEVANPVLDQEILANALQSKASILRAKHCFPESLSAAKESVEVARALAKEFPEGFSHNFIDCLNELKRVYSDMDNQEEKLLVLEELISIGRVVNLSKPMASPLAGSLHEYADTLLELNRLDEAYSAISEAVDIRNSQAEADPEGYCESLSASLAKMAEVVAAHGEAEKCLEVFERAVQIRRSLTEVSKIPNARASLHDLLVIVILLLLRFEKYDVALQYCKEALENLRIDESSDALKKAGLLSFLAQIHIAMGNIDEALNAGAEAVALGEIEPIHGGQALNFVLCLYTLGEILCHRNEYERAVVLTERSVNVARSVEGTDLMAKEYHLSLALHNYAFSLGHLDRFDEALLAINESLRITEKQLNSKFSNYSKLGLSKSVLAMILVAQGQLIAADAACREAIEAVIGLPDFHLPNISCQVLQIAGSNLEKILSGQNLEPSEDTDFLRAIGRYRQLSPEASQDEGA